MAWLYTALMRFLIFALLPGANEMDFSHCSTCTGFTSGRRYDLQPGRIHFFRQPSYVSCVAYALRFSSSATSSGSCDFLIALRRSFGSKDVLADLPLMPPTGRSQPW